jgi:hypothetical protein
MILIIGYIYSETIYVTYSTLKDDCLTKIENKIDPFIFFEEEDDLSLIKKKYRKLALSCHPDRFLYKGNETNLEVMENNIMMINNYFETIKNYKVDSITPIIIVPQHYKENKKYYDFPFKERFLFKFKRYLYTIIGVIIFIGFIFKPKFRKWFSYLFVTCLIFISFYLIGISGTIFLFSPFFYIIFNFLPVCFLLFLLSIFKFNFHFSITIFIPIFITYLLYIIFKKCFCKKIKK